MIQGGDPTGTGRGGTSIYGDKFEDEIHPELKRTSSSPRCPRSWLIKS
jgi:peptidyl-prolyl cis-trans isomerase-like 1